MTVEQAGENAGKLAEDFVEQLCTRSFFADFTFRGPKYRKAGGQEKEAADLLVVFDKTVLAIQVKSKAMEVKDGQITERTISRLEGKIEEGARQFRAFGEALRNTSFNSFVNARGVEVQFEKSKIEDVVLLVVIVPVWKQPEERLPLRIRNTCNPNSDIPLHALSAEQFEVLLILADTLPDFLKTLDLCWLLHRESLVHHDTDPVDVWTFSIFERPRLMDCLQRNVQVDLTGITTRHKEALRRMEESERSSYMIDRAVQGLSNHAGTPFPTDARLLKFTTPLSEPNSVKALLSVIPFLARLDRAERLQVAEGILEKIGESENRYVTFRGIKFPKYEEGYFIFVSAEPTTTRQVAMFNSARAFGLRMNLNKVVCLGVDPRAGDPSEVMIVDISNQVVSEDIKSASRELFAHPYETDLPRPS